MRHSKELNEDRLDETVLASGDSGAASWDPRVYLKGPAP